MRKTVKYFEEKINLYKNNLKEINSRIRRVKKELKNENGLLTEKREKTLHEIYSKLLSLKERLEKKIIECTVEYNKKWKNRNNRTNSTIKKYTKTNLIKESYIFSELKKRLLNK